MVFICLAIPFLISIPYQTVADPLGVISPATFPRIALLTLIFLCLVLVAQEVASFRVSEVPRKPQERGNPIKVIISLLILLLYVALIYLFGYIISTAVTLFLFVLYLGGTNYKTVSIFSIILTLFLYFFFYKALKVPLPESVFFQ